MLTKKFIKWVKEANKISGELHSLYHEIDSDYAIYGDWAGVLSSDTIDKIENMEEALDRSEFRFMPLVKDIIKKYIPTGLYWIDDIPKGRIRSDGTYRYSGPYGNYIYIPIENGQWLAVEYQW